MNNLQGVLKEETSRKKTFGRAGLFLIISIVMMAGFFLIQTSLDSGTAQAKTAYKVYLKEPMNLRSKASTSGSILTCIPKKKTLTATYRTKPSGSSYYWYKVTYNSKTGYIYGGYLTLKSSEADYSPHKTGVTTAVLLVRQTYSTRAKLMGQLDKGTKKTLYGYHYENGEKWYKVKYNGSYYWVYAKYVKVQSQTTDTGSGSTGQSGMSDSQYIAYLKQLGFPSSYCNDLLKLHKAHPKWIFRPQKTGLAWGIALKSQYSLGENLVAPEDPINQRSKSSKVYDSKRKVWTKRFDGRWYQASEKTIAYYFDPRNFLTDTGIYQFMDHYYRSSGQTPTTVRNVVDGSFMDNATHANTIYLASKSAKVNPNVVSAMLLQEQGYKMGSLVSGTVPGYIGYYNYFNFGAWSHSGRSAVTNGLIYAKQQGWNSRYKSIRGGAYSFYKNYTSKRQNTYYTKKFNVYNGWYNLGSHQYCTYVKAAQQEGSLMKRAYKSSTNYALTFYIPVYTNMPTGKCPAP